MIHLVDLAIFQNASIVKHGLAFLWYLSVSDANKVPLMRVLPAAITAMNCHLGASDVVDAGLSFVFMLSTKPGTRTVNFGTFWEGCGGRGRRGCPHVDLTW